MAARAAGRVRELDIPPGLKARQVQKFLSSRNDTVHAAISGRRVRYVTAGAGGVSGWNERPAEPKFEDGFMYALRQHLESHGALPDIAEDPLPPEPAVRTEEAAPLVVKVEKLLKVFGSFTAVDNIDFEVRKGEVFGLLGANGAGKSTTFRMLCGLSRPDGGTLEVAGVNFRRAAAKMRRKLGYVAQKFSLYGDLSVRENMEFYGGAYGLTGNRLRERINWAETTFSLQAYRDTATAQIPGGFQRRLSMACALLHEPEIIFLDEPTSGADPLARREFWLRINELADSGVTVIITTHFLDEAEFCDRMVIMQDGRIPAAGTPEEIRRHGATADCPEPPLEEAFVEIIRKFRREQEAKGT